MVTDHAVLIRDGDTGTSWERIDGQPGGASPTKRGGVTAKGRTSPGRKQEAATPQDILVVPAGTTRYQMTPAQVALVTLGYGLGDVADSWEGLEDATATFLALRLMAVATCTYGELVTMFLPHADVSHPWYKRTVKYHSVIIIRAQTWLEDAGMSSGAAVALMEEVERLISEGYAVVIVNGPKASHGDVFAVTTGLVSVDQCKFYSTTPFTPSGVRHELAKAGFFTPEEWKADATKKTNTDTSTKRAKKQVVYRAVIDALVRLAADVASGLQGPGTSASGVSHDVIPAPFVLWEFVTTVDDVEIPRDIPRGDRIKCWNVRKGATANEAPTLPMRFPQLRTRADEFVVFGEGRKRPRHQPSNTGAGGMNAPVETTDDDNRRRR